MAESYKVLLLGSSAYTYHEGDPEEAGFPFLKREIARLRPDILWEVVLEPVNQGRSLPERALALARKHRPDVIVLNLASAAVAEEFVVNRIRRRWPRVYSASLKASQLLKGAAGNQAEGRVSPRSLLYQFPEWIAFHLIGGDPAIPPEYAVANVSQALSNLSTLEEVTIIVRLGAGLTRGSKARRARYSRRRDMHKAAVLADCAKRHITAFDLFEVMASKGFTPGRAKDGIHLDTASHHFEMRHTVDLILRELNITEGVTDAGKEVAANG